MKVAGAKTIKTKSLKSEMLPSRMAKATITDGDLMRRMGNYYGKESTPGAQTGPSAIIAFTTIGRGFGMA